MVSEPRRNHLIAKDSDKDDPWDAEKLAPLFRGGYLKAVHQAATLERALLKQQVSFYHDRVRDRVRWGHQVVAQFRRHGVFPRIAELTDPSERAGWLRKLPNSRLLRLPVQQMLESYDLALAHKGKRARN